MLNKFILIALLGVSTSVMANGWQVKVGGSVVAPTSDTKTALGTFEADHEYAFTPSVEYFFADNFSAELLLATPISHTVLLDGQSAVKLKHLPPTLTAKYHFKNSSAFTPYIGVGGVAFIPWDESERGAVKGLGAKVHVKEDYGFAGQIGFNFQPADAKNWGVFFDARYAQISPEVTAKIGGVTALKFDLDIDPMVYTLGYSYKF
jgi:outer membrane protein